MCWLQTFLVWGPPGSPCELPPEVQASVFKTWLPRAPAAMGTGLLGVFVRHAMMILEGEWKIIWWRFDDLVWMFGWYLMMIGMTHGDLGWWLTTMLNYCPIRRIHGGVTGYSSTHPHRKVKIWWLKTSVKIGFMDHWSGIMSQWLDIDCWDDWDSEWWFPMSMMKNAWGWAGIPKSPCSNAEAWAMDGNITRNKWGHLPVYLCWLVGFALNQWGFAEKYPNFHPLGVMVPIGNQRNTARGGFLVVIWCNHYGHLMDYGQLKGLLQWSFVGIEWNRFIRSKTHLPPQNCYGLSQVALGCLIFFQIGQDCCSRFETFYLAKHTGDDPIGREATEVCFDGRIWTVFFFLLIFESLLWSWFLKKTILQWCNFLEH